MALTNTIIGVETHFDAAHFLPNYNGSCANLHGHTWHLKIEVMGEVQKNGMVIDIRDLKSILKSITIPLDHATLNNFNTTAYTIGFEVEKMPTCENLLTYIFHKLNDLLPLYIHLYSIELKEGDGGYAKWIRM